MPQPEPPQDRLTGSTLRAMREGVKLTQRDLAKAAGVHHSHIGRIETGERIVGPELMHQLLQVIADRLSGDAA